MSMRRLAFLLAALLLAGAGLSPARLVPAQADDVPARVWRRLLERSPDPERPTLGLLAYGDLGPPSLDADPDERPGREDEEDEEDDDPVAWLLSWGRGSEVAAGLLRRVAVDAEVRTPDGRLHRGRLVAAPGRRALLARTRCLRVVANYSPELACDNSGGLRPSAVGDPLLESLLDGLALDVRPFVVGTGRIALEVLLQAGRFERPVERLATRALYLGDLDLPRYHGALLSASGTTDAGQPLHLSLEGAEGERYDVRLTPRILDAPAREDGPRRTVHRLDAGFLVTPPRALRFAGEPDAWFNPPAHVSSEVVWTRPVADRSTIWTTIDRALPEVEMRLLPGGDVWLVAAEDEARRVGRTLDAWTSLAARTVRIEITARAGAAEDVGRVDVPVLTVPVLTVPVLTGRTAFFRLGVDRALLLDSDVEVG